MCVAYYAQVSTIVRMPSSTSQGGGKLTKYKQPRMAVFTDVIPRNPTGKALKRVLREQFATDAPEVRRIT